MLGLKVTLDVHGQGGTIAIHYRTLEQLDDVLRRLKNV
jgi:ParB family chromosome partitioning protein